MQARPSPQFLLAAFVLVSANLWAAPINYTPPNPLRPNIIWIIANDLGYGDLGSYGQKEIKTVHLDRMAREGMRFTSFTAPSPENLVTRASMLTGRDPRHLDLYTNAPVAIEPGIPTVSQILKESGYRTGYLGNWALGEPHHYSQPQRKGFIDWAGTLVPQKKLVLYPRTMWRTDPLANVDRLISIPQWPGKYTSANEFYMRGLTNYVRIHPPDPYNKFTPFFLVVSFALPNPLDLHPGHTNDFRAVPTDGRYGNKTWPKPHKQRAAAVTQLDQYVGNLFRTLESHKQVTNTVVFLTSDGGAFERNKAKADFFKSNGPLRGRSGDLTEGGLRVPLLVRWVTKVNPSQTNHLMFTHADLMPTTLELAGAKPPKGLDGISFANAVFSRKQTNLHESFVWEGTNGVAIRESAWKAIYETNTWTLFNLEHDLGEATNVVEEHSAVLERLKGHLVRWRRDDAESESAPAGGSN